jgi:hypothetical protein
VAWQLHCEWLYDVNSHVTRLVFTAKVTMLLFNNNSGVRFVKYALRVPDPHGKEKWKTEQSKEVKTQQKPGVNTDAIITRPWSFIQAAEWS